MPVTRDPQTNTIGYTIHTAVADAWRFVTDNPVANSTNESRVAYHAIMSYFRELGVHTADIHEVMRLLVEGEMAEFGRGWAAGWDAGWESAKKVTAPPF
jgi:hypothetical protein